MARYPTLVSGIAWGARRLVAASGMSVPDSAKGTVSHTANQYCNSLAYGMSYSATRYASRYSTSMLSMPYAMAVQICVRLVAARFFCTGLSYGTT
eukprot:2219563-Rhodomonas_salina.3